MTLWHECFNSLPVRKLVFREVSDTPELHSQQCPEPELELHSSPFEDNFGRFQSFEDNSMFFSLLYNLSNLVTSGLSEVYHGNAMPILYTNLIEMS